MISDLDLMRIRTSTLYLFDERGRMVRTNELDGQPAPRVFLGRAASEYIVRFGETLPDVSARNLIGMVKSRSPSSDLLIPQSLRDAIRAELERDAPIGKEGGGPAYRFPEEMPQSTDVVQMTDKNIQLARETYPWLQRQLADLWPSFAVVSDGKAVSVCFSSRIGADAAEAGVETLPEHRGRGFATRVTAAWGSTIRASGRIPIYSTWWENLASRAIARRLGLNLFGVDATWR